jgi:hypothetical protein
VVGGDGEGGLALDLEQYRGIDPDLSKMVALFLHIFSGLYSMLPVQARWIKSCLRRFGPLARRQPSVDLGPLDVLAGAAFLAILPNSYATDLFANRTWCVRSRLTSAARHPQIS